MSQNLSQSMLHISQQNLHDHSRLYNMQLILFLRNLGVLMKYTKICSQETIKFTDRQWYQRDIGELSCFQFFNFFVMAGDKNVKSEGAPPHYCEVLYGLNKFLVAPTVDLSAEQNSYTKTLHDINHIFCHYCTAESIMVINGNETNCDHFVQVELMRTERDTAMT